MLGFFNYRTINLPTTSQGFEDLVDVLMSKYGLTDRNHTAAILSVAIRHLPNHQATTTYQYLGHYILKNLANYLANHKSQVLQHESEVAQLVEMIKKDPSDQQAIDELQKAADQGSESAKAALKAAAANDPQQ